MLLEFPQKDVPVIGHLGTSPPSLTPEKVPWSQIVDLCSLRRTQLRQQVLEFTLPGVKKNTPLGLNVPVTVKLCRKNNENFQRDLVCSKITCLHSKTVISFNVNFCERGFIFLFTLWVVYVNFRFLPSEISLPQVTKTTRSGN